MELLRQASDNYLLSSVSLMMGARPISYWMKTFWDWETDRGPVVTTSFGMPKKLERLQKDPRGSILLWKADGSDMEDKPIILVQGHFEFQKPLEDLKTHDATAWLKYAPRWLRINPDFMSVCLHLLADGKSDHPLTEWFLHRIILKMIPKKITCWRDGDLNNKPEIVER
jgi:hypothetical protein